MRDTLWNKRRRAIGAATLLCGGMAAAGMSAGCEQLLGLGEFKNCPQDQGCPAAGGAGGGGISCAAPADCPVGDECTSPVCTAGKCGLTAKDDGIACMAGAGSGFRCKGGACACPTENACGAACVDTAIDAMNCGACGMACPAGIACVAGACACPDGGTVCGAACVDTQTDAMNCGSCGKACTVAGAMCAMGACACPGGGTECGGACVDTQTDAMNCGMCGNACMAPTTECASATCVCPGGQMECSGVCVDTGTDPKNCGACGHDCLGGGCQGGMCQPVVLASGQTTPSDLAINATDIYWTTHGSPQKVMKMPLGGGTPIAVATGTSQQTEFYLALNGSGVYWTFRTGLVASGYTWTVMRAPLGGGAATTLATVQTPAFGKGLLGLAADATYVYWVDSDTQAISRIPSAGGTVTVVNSSFGFGSASSFLVASGRFWLINAGSLYSAVLANGVFNQVAANMVSDFAVDASSVYWSDASAVAKAPIAGGTATTLAALQLAGPVTVDAASAYYSDNYILRKVPIGGGPAVALAACNGQSLVMDGTYVYWTDLAAGAIDRVVK